MPEDHNERIRKLEIHMAEITQRVADHEQDFYRFGPLVTEQALTRATLERMEMDLRQAHDALRELRVELDKESRARIYDQQERKKELAAAVEARTKEIQAAETTRKAQTRELQNRIRVATIALIGVFLTSSTSVLAAILAGH